MSELSMTDVGALLASPWLQRLLVGLLAVLAGLFTLSVFSRLELSWAARGTQALRAYTTEEIDTPVERLGAWVVKRFPGLSNLLGLALHRRWLALVGPVWSPAATVGVALLFALAGLALFLLAQQPLLLVAPVIGFLLPFVRQRSAAEKVKRQVQNTLPDLSAMLAAEMAANNPPDRALERAAELGGPLAAILKIAIQESSVSGRPLFGRGKVSGLLVDIAGRYPLPALRAFVAQIDMAAKTGAAGPELMSSLAHTLIVEYKDRALREAEALDSRLAVPTVGFFFLPFMFLILVPLLLPVLNVL